MDKESFIVFGGKKMWFRFAYPKKKNNIPAILFIHGSRFSTSFNFLIDKLKKEFVCFSFAHLGCYKSQGNVYDYSLASRLDQALSVFSRLESLKNVNKNEITVVGVSMGGHVAARLAQKKPIKNLILRAPASYGKTYENIKMSPGWLPWNKGKKDWPFSPSYALDAIAKFRGNLLIIQCEKDQIIPKKIIRAYYDEATRVKSKKLSILKNAAHYIGDDPVSTQKFQQLIADLIKSTLHATF